MNRNNKKLLLGVTLMGVTSLSLGFIFSSSNDNSSYLYLTNADNSKSVIDISSTSLTLSNNYSVSIESEGYTDGSLFSLSPGGYIRNTEPIRGITSISVNYLEGSGWAKIVPCFYDYENGGVVTSIEEWPEANTIANLSSSPIDYFELYNPSEEDDITITSISITYSCSTSSYTFSISFTPNWNGNTASEHADIYIAGTKDLISDGTTSGNWNYKKLTYNNGTYSYTAPNSLPTGKYVYGLYALENGASFNWSNPNSENNINLFLTSDTVDNHSYSWEYEPGYTSPTSYSATVIINLGTNDHINYLELKYLKSENNNATIYDGGCTETIGKNWEALSESSNTFVVTNIEQGYALYFAFKTYDWDVSGNVIIDGDNGWHALRYVPLQLKDITITIDCDSYGSDKTAGGVVAYSSASLSNIEYGVISAAIEVENSISHNDVALSGVYDTATISPIFTSGVESFTASYNGENIRIDDNLTITGIKAGTTTEVTLTTLSGATCTFDVIIPSSTYVASKDLAYCGGSNAVSVREGWFSSTSVSEISNMGSDFYNGIDTSSFYALINNGSKYYNSDGVEEHLFYILKHAGVNWIRLKLWVDPQTNKGVSYGGGESNLANTLWMAKEAKASGLNLLLDFHYSDYWTHPGQQIIPKSWNDCTSKSALCNRIKSYTTETLEAFENINALPDMVQLGNEISSGIYLQKYSGSSETFTEYGEPSYLKNKSSYSYGTTDNSQYYDYIKAASEGVDAVNSGIKKVIHWAKGSTISASVINDFFNNMPSAYYDYAAISFYPFYCFDTMNVAKNILNGLSLAKPWFIAETSYPFSGSGYTTEGSTQFTISNDNHGDTNIYNSYAFNSSGQANLIHDLTSAVVNAGGKGIFYWESAWVPNLNVGWAGSGSKNTWGNQGFFSFDGKAIANLDLFVQMSNYI